MCGICGFYGIRNRHLLESMTAVLSHRGPDAEGFYEDDFVSLGHRRLSIIDLSPQGKQPMCNEDGTIWLVFNGEIYNFQDLRNGLEAKGHIFKSRTDSEAIIHAYEENGLECVENFRGMFAFALWDTNKKRLVICRDRIGKKPLYYWWNGERLIFASELKSLIRCQEISKTVNLEGFHAFLAFQYIPGVETAIEDIKRVPAGHMLILENGNMRQREYWSIKKITNICWQGSEKKALNEIHNRLQESVSMRLISDVPLGVFLSGGLDSSSIVALMSKSGMKSIKTFSVGFGERSDELKYAKIVSKEFNTEHREFIVNPNSLIGSLEKIVWYMDEPIADGGAFATYMVSEIVKQYVKVVLVGEGADELFGGYSWHKLASPYFNFIPRTIKKHFYFYLNTFYRGWKDNCDIYKRFEGLFNSENRHQDFLSEMTFFEMGNLLPNCLLMKVDKMTMAHSLEARVPFLDHTIVEFAVNLPAAFKIRNFTQDKYILRKCMDKMLPHEIAKRKKHGFLIPVRKWLRGELKGYVHDLLINKNSFSAQVIGLERLKVLTAPQRGLKALEHSIMLWRLLIFELWIGLYIKHDGAIN